MSLSTVNIQVLGRIGQDATVRPVKEYFAISFSVAVSEKRQNDQWITHWFNFTYWNKSDKVAKFLTKGKLVSVIADWVEVTEKEGKTYINYRVKDLNPFLEKKEESNISPVDTNYDQSPSAANTISDEEDDDLPF